VTGTAPAEAVLDEGAEPVAPRRGSMRDYFQLTKARMALFSALIAAGGYYVAALGPISWAMLLHVCVGTILVCAGAFSLNMYLERDLDVLMHRTQKRPLPSGRIEPSRAIAVGIFFSVVGLAYLGYFCNLLTAAVGAVAAGSYVAIYTPMKRLTNLNTIVGAFPGALPPVIGWTAARGELSFGAGLLFAILFMWQLPHFLALAWMYKDDYARAGMPMITTMDERGGFTARQMVIYAAAYLLVCLMPTRAGLAGELYFWGALVSGLAFLGLCVRWAIPRDRKGAVHVFLASLVHLPLIFLLLVVDKSAG